MELENKTITADDLSVQPEATEVEPKQDTPKIDISTLKNADIDAMGDDARQLASRMGWKSPDEWKGDKSRLVDEKTYIKHGLNENPVLKKQHGKALNEIDELRALIVEQKQMTAKQMENTRKREQAKWEGKIKELERAKTQAKEDLDTDKLEGTMEEIASAKDNLREIKEEEKQNETPKNSGTDPYVASWMESDTGKKIEKDNGLRIMFMGKLQEMDAFYPQMPVKDKFQKAEEFVRSEFSSKFDTAYKASASLGGNNGVNLNQSKGEKTYQAIPSSERDSMNRIMTQQVKYQQSKHGFKNEADKKAFVSKLQKEYASDYFSE